MDDTDVASRLMSECPLMACIFTRKWITICLLSHDEDVWEVEDYRCCIVCGGFRLLGYVMLYRIVMKASPGDRTIVCNILVSMRE